VTLIEEKGFELRTDNFINTTINRVTRKTRRRETKTNCFQNRSTTIKTCALLLFSTHANAVRVTFLLLFLSAFRLFRQQRYVNNVLSCTFRRGGKDGSVAVQFGTLVMSSLSARLFRHEPTRLSPRLNSDDNCIFINNNPFFFFFGRVVTRVLSSRV